MTPLVVVTATTDPVRADRAMKTWGDVPKIVVLNGPHGALMVTNPTVYDPAFNVLVLSAGEYLGTVEAFRRGVDFALDHTDAGVIACLHDDLLLYDSDWAEKVVERFARQPEMGLLGFGGAIGLGDSDIYEKPYQPVQLARQGFRSNLVDAEVHGARSLLAERVAVLDGFSQIGRRDFWDGYGFGGGEVLVKVDPRPWTALKDLGLVHHIYDGALGLLAARAGWETWYLPIRCEHLGGQTAVGDPGYQAWADTQTPGGDHGFWEQGHAIVYGAFEDVLPLRV